MTQQRDMGSAISTASPFVRARGAGAVTIAPARLRDLRAMTRLQRRAFRPALAYGFGTLLFLWLVPRVRCLVARDERGIVGCAIGDLHDGDGRVISLCVDPDARRRGIGARLLRALEEALPMGNVLLMVEQDNSAAQSLYRREGYVAVGVARDYYGRGHHGVWMQKQRLPEATRKLWF